LTLTFTVSIYLNLIFAAFKSALNDLKQTLTDHEKARGVTNPKINQILKLTDLFAKLDRDKMRSKTNSPSKNLYD
jgi:hypothetical protein